MAGFPDEPIQFSWPAMLAVAGGLRIQVPHTDGTQLSILSMHSVRRSASCPVSALTPPSHIRSVVHPEVVHFGTAGAGVATRARGGVQRLLDPLPQRARVQAATTSAAVSVSASALSPKLIYAEFDSAARPLAEQAGGVGWSSSSAWFAEERKRGHLVEGVPVRGVLQSSLIHLLLYTSSRPVRGTYILPKARFASPLFLFSFPLSLLSLSYFLHLQPN
ncbi:hypothetical protein DFH06DRAFT_1122202 [Mycena polygramma]|nr:hypothetical protein DFH06DRAFT_1122202 [Mycena polygramma]